MVKRDSTLHADGELHIFGLGRHVELGCGRHVIRRSRAIVRHIADARNAGHLVTRELQSRGNANGGITYATTWSSREL